MEQREMKLRQQLGRHGYKLKKAEKGYFVKGSYTKKVMSPLTENNQPIYMTLDEVENWLNEKINEENQKKKLWEDTLNKYRNTIKYPEYGEWCRNVVFDTLKRFSTNGNRSRWVINEDRNFIEKEIFNPQSELYAFTGFGTDCVLDELHLHKVYEVPMSEEVQIAFSEVYYKKYEELNNDILEKEFDDGECILQDLVGDGKDTENDLLQNAYEEISIDELKKIVLGTEE